MTKFVRVQVVKQACEILIPKKLYQQHAIALNREWDGADLGESLRFLFGLQSEEDNESVEEIRQVKTTPFQNSKALARKILQ